MAAETAPQTFSGDLRGAHFTRVTLAGARVEEADLGGVVARGVNLAGADLDDPFLCGGESTLLIDGVDVVPLVDAELNRRFPGRDQRRATDPAGLRTAWSVVADGWAAAVARVASMPEGTVDARVDGEWSFAETLRHLVLATDLWLRKAVQRVEQPLHPLGLIDTAGLEEFGSDAAGDAATLRDETPPYAEVLEARAGRQTMVREFLASTTPEQLDEVRANPHEPGHRETVRSCLHTILEEEWEHLRFATRDLDVLDR